MHAANRLSDTRYSAKVTNTLLKSSAWL